MTEEANGDRTGSAEGPGTWRSVVRRLAVVGIPLGVVLVLAWTFLSPLGYWPGSSMTTAWTTPLDKVAPVPSTHRSWLVGDTLVRARYNAVTGFDAASGERRWEYAPPRRRDICAASETADGSRLLIAYTEDIRKPGAGCTTVAALDLAVGRELWHTALTPAHRDTTDGLGALAVGGGLGVVLDASAGTGAPAVRAVDLRTGSPRWRGAVPKGCVPGSVAISPRQVLAVLTCGEERKLAAFDPSDGHERWTTAVDTRDGVPAGASVTVTATEPIVLRVAKDRRDVDSYLREEGVEAFLTFDAEGRPGARIETNGEGYGSIGTQVVVSDQRLFARTSGGGWGLVVAFDLTTGRELWQEAIGGKDYAVQGLHAQDGRVMVVNASHRYGDILNVFDAATGDEEEDRHFRDDTGDVDRLLLYGDRFIAVRSGGSAAPFTAYQRW
ncbi:PQQ-binding-like beta-propeller repeat protein [Streptomyces sp. NPDC093225]|uniref:outer membrane protein assembly factor BamB family protein n=1 Tax=Streptomyces sp. NPDC093225 TaxID=3366034 RepID=UPI003806A50C